jgi:hypothetical protein
LPAATAEEEDEHRLELERFHRTLALSGVEIDTCHGKWDEAIGGHPSTGAAPQLLQLPDLDSPPPITATERGLSQIQPSTDHKTNRQLYILEKEGQ